MPRWASGLGLVLLIAALAAGAFLFAKEQAQSGGDGPATAVGGLPNTPDYHSLLVAPGDPGHILLGTHAGLYESLDGGRNWRQVALVGQDAMNLARSEGETVWAAGHNVLARSPDGGESWSDVRPDGLPSLDVHGFAVDPRDGTLWAAVAGEGLYRSTDGGESFALVSEEVGGNVMALAVTPEGRLLAGDMQQGLLASENEGKDWRVAEPAAVMGLAVNPEDPTVVVAAGPGILRSSDGGASWEQV
ncbi:MAG: WD40/YVTN/BNR-like repeat-containing protein, partial [Gaiellaceae bacterium]